MRSCVVVDRKEAPSVLRRLLDIRAVEETLRIKAEGSKIYIPLKNEGPKGDFTVTESEFELRAFQTSPQSMIREELKKAGLDIHNMEGRWVRLGSAMVMKFPEVSQNVKVKIASIYSSVLGVESIYETRGRISGMFREPAVGLVFGPGGETTHRENGIFYTFDPSRVMFSPGNVNIRTSVRDLDLREKTVVDMFAGIGYFSLGIAKYSKASKVHAFEINPVSYNYLQRNVISNRLQDKVVTHRGDCRTSDQDVAGDVVVMGNFLSFSYLPHALKRVRKNGTIIMHDVVPTDKLVDYGYRLCRRIREYGYQSVLLEQKTVKSFAPHMWHIYIRLNVEAMFK